MCNNCGCNVNMFDYEGENDPDFDAEGKTDLMYFTAPFSIAFPTRKEANAWVREYQPAFKYPLKVRKMGYPGEHYVMYALPSDYVMRGMKAEEFEAPQATINPQWAMNMIQSQYDNVGIDRVLSVREDFEGDLFITILLTNGNKQQLIIEKSMIGMDVTEDYEKWGAEEFESEFSKGDMLNLKKYIDYPMRWINKQIAPSNERKARKFEQKERGQIPTKREPEDFRQSIKTPTWFKAVQFGLIASVVGVMGLVDTKRTTDEEPEEPEEQKEE